MIPDLFLTDFDMQEEAKFMLKWMQNNPFMKLRQPENMRTLLLTGTVSQVKVNSLLGMRFPSSSIFLSSQAIELSG